MACVLLLTTALLGAAPGLHDCPTTNASGHSACPADSQCCFHQYVPLPYCVYLYAKRRVMHAVP
jgi:hypothetical protein